MSEKRVLQLLVAVFTILVWVEVKGSWLFDPDEARYAEIPREMMTSGDYVTPRLNGSHYFEKPPLLYWANAASMKLFGENPYAARLPTRAAAMGTALLLLFLLPTRKNPLVGWWAALIYLSAPLSFGLSRVNLTDGPLTFGMALTFLSLRKFIQAADRGEKTFFWKMAAGLGSAIAVLSKGPVGLILPGAVFFLWVAVMRRWELFWDVLLSFGTILFLAVTVPWFVLVEKANPGFSKFFFIHEHILRYATKEAMRHEPFYFFLGTFIWGFLPWLDPFIRSIKSFVSKISEIRSSQPDNFFFILWFFFILFFFSVSQSKLIPYILPAFPAAAALSALWITNSQKKKFGWWKSQTIILTLAIPGALILSLHSGFLQRYDLTRHAYFLTLFSLLGAWLAIVMSKRGGKQALLAQILSWGALYSVLIFTVDNLARDYSEHDLAQEALRLNGDQIVAYQCYPQSFPWVLKHPIPVADSQGELASDNIKSPDLFWDAKTFWDHWNSNERLMACLPRREVEKFDGLSNKKAFIIKESRRSTLIANFKPS